MTTSNCLYKEVYSCYKCLEITDQESKQQRIEHLALVFNLSKEEVEEILEEILEENKIIEIW